MRAIALLSLSLSLIACGPATEDGGGAEVPKGSPPIAKLWLSKCGSCHERPQPKLRPRDYIEAAAKRHKKRVPMEDEEWAAMIDFMAK